MPVETKVVKPPGLALASVLKKIEKEVGPYIISKGDTIPPVQRLPTGNFDFDFALGGGFPKGRYSIIYGPESSCKTNIALRAVRSCQMSHDGPKETVWFNIETTLDKVWGTKMGVNMSDLNVVNPAFGEQAMDLFDEIVRADDVGLVIVDSLAALVSNKELEQSTEKYDVGSSALLIKRMVNRLMFAFAESAKKDHFPCIIFINQIRFKPGVVVGNPETMPGGEAQKFLSSLRIRTSAQNITEASAKQIVAKDIHVIVKKAKVPVRSTDFKFRMAMMPQDGVRVGETDSFNLVKNYLNALGFFAKDKKGYVLHTANGDLFFPKVEEFRERYLTNSEFALDMQTMVNNEVQEKVMVDEPQPQSHSEQPGVVIPVEPV
jgi:recombination protein RecA